jgi:NADPH:quinone reductase-like Zn-dependent oxidoreductase
MQVYATVGTQEKRDFLKSNYGISDDRIFSSRNTEFAQKILQMTDGKGVDVILNSLAGDLLDESWRIIATGGTMVEIGKKDILDRNMLSMEPFNRNASFRALDLSHENISDDTLSRYFTASVFNYTSVAWGLDLCTLTQ